MPVPRVSTAPKSPGFMSVAWVVGATRERLVCGVLLPVTCRAALRCRPMRVDLFDYDLPADRIAQEARPRGTSRLLVLGREDRAIAHRRFTELPSILKPGDLLVRNDVRVRPARLYGRDREGRVVEIFLLSPADPDQTRWVCLAKPGRRAKAGLSIVLEADVSAVVEEVRSDGTRLVRFNRPLDPSLLERIGRTPLPPYIR